ncbi:hypothetical protein Aab01nite_36260 [Paractinoplanes abujensis]|uniref:Nucleic acid binding protein n=1 Tax=Paractinoplanes abujensis TaxID=882441 RepID=A0A7W7CU58_9ACTN|nr:hypothetical protein [Actinoplanes abujensis]MBB4694752.1 hypothetical protein [Actinoplanes abujensis]GID20036.1 hypothetical protein Aab01nite_36260 [Actinoplanes abujensis]
MVTRTVPAVLLLLLVAAGCANNASETGAAAPAPSSSASDVVDLPVPTAKTSGPAGEPGRPNAGAKTITGTVTAGVEPNCLLLTDDSGSHLLIFDDPAMRSDAAVGSKVKISGHAEPGMMSTCQQGVPFVVTAVEKG